MHYPAEAGRELHAVYQLLSITHNRRLHMEATAPDADPHIPSLVGVYPTCDWHDARPGTSSASSSTAIRR